MSEATHADVAIIGAGFGGLVAAIRLERAGFEGFLTYRWRLRRFRPADYAVLERPIVAPVSTPEPATEVEV